MAEEAPKIRQDSRAKSAASSCRTTKATAALFRPASGKIPWGTIMKPEFLANHRFMTPYQVQQLVLKTYFLPARYQGPIYARTNEVYPKGGHQFNDKEALAIVTRLSGRRDLLLPNIAVTETSTKIDKSASRGSKINGHSTSNKI